MSYYYAIVALCVIGLVNVGVMIWIESYKKRASVNNLSDKSSEESIDEDFLDDSEDLVYVEFEETIDFVHMWQNEPATGENIKYIGRFAKYNIYDMADILVKFAAGKEYMLSTKTMPKGLREKCNSDDKNLEFDNPSD